MKREIKVVVALAAVVCVGFGAYMSMNNSKNTVKEVQEEVVIKTDDQNNEVVEVLDNAEIANPWVEFTSLSDAVAAVGFDFTAPDYISGYDNVSYGVMEEDKLIQALFTTGDNSDACVEFRKAEGSDDISGVYTTYSTNEIVVINGKEVVMQGDDGIINLVTWVDGNYSYSIYASLGFTQEVMFDYVAQVA